MSTYEPVEKAEEGSSHDPGVKSKQVADERDLTARVGAMDKRVRVMLAIAAITPVSTMGLAALVELFPEHAATAMKVLGDVASVLPFFF